MPYFIEKTKAYFKFEMNLLKTKSLKEKFIYNFSNYVTLKKVPFYDYNFQYFFDLLYFYWKALNESNINEIMILSFRHTSYFLKCITTIVYLYLYLSLHTNFAYKTTNFLKSNFVLHSLYSVWVKDECNFLFLFLENIFKDLVLSHSDILVTFSLISFLLLLCFIKGQKVALMKDSLTHSDLKAKRNETHFKDGVNKLLGWINIADFCLQHPLP